MNLSIWQSMALGLLSGFSELLPISAEAHRALGRNLMGIAQEAGVFRLILHLACLLALVWSQREELSRLRRTRALLHIPARRRKQTPQTNVVLLLKLLQMAMVPMVLGKLLTGVFSFVQNEPQILAFTVSANGLLLLLPSLVRNGNKDPRNMPRVDALVMGLAAALSAIPGFSFLGCVLAAGISRGADRKFALKFANLLLIPGLGMQLIFDIIGLFSGAAAAFSPVGLMVALLGGVCCFAGALIGKKLMEFLSYSSNFSAFSYYCFGVGLFTFLLFLTV